MFLAQPRNKDNNRDSSIKEKWKMCPCLFGFLTSATEHRRTQGTRTSLRTWNIIAFITGASRLNGLCLNFVTWRIWPSWWSIRWNLSQSSVGGIFRKYLPDARRESYGENRYRISQPRNRLTFCSNWLNPFTSYVLVKNVLNFLAKFAVSAWPTLLTGCSS